jgi:Tfp pilus assembly protein PilO
MKFDFNKILEHFNNLNDQTRYAVFGGVVVVFILLDVFLLALPQIGAITGMHAQMKQMSEDTQQVLTDRQRIGQLRKNLQMSRDQLSALSARVRPVQEVPAILSTISSIANDYGVKIDQLVPEKGQQETLTSSADGKYYALPVVIKAHCGYHMFGHFLNKLENENLYFLMKDFIIQNDAKDTNTHLFSLTIKIILVDQTQTAAPSKKL